MYVALIILVVTVLGTLFVRKLFGALADQLLPKKKWAALGSKAVGWGLGMLYLYFAGYFVMGKDVNLLLAWLVALAPLAVFAGWKLTRHASVMEGQ